MEQLAAVTEQLAAVTEQPAVTVEQPAVTVEQPAVTADGQLFKRGELTTWARENVAGGKGTLAGKFSFTRNDAKIGYTIKEIGWMTLAPGDSIGSHRHEDNEDSYIIIAGEGEFTDNAGVKTTVGEGDITIARPGQSHGLANTGTVPLIFLDIVAKDSGDAQGPKETSPADAQVFKRGDLKTWDREDVAGGKGTLAGLFSFTRNDAKISYTIKEIGWMTLAPGDSIGSHRHEDNEDSYIIMLGQGEFTDSAGVKTPVDEGDITIARPGQSHGLANTGTVPLLFLDIVAKDSGK
jgi:mannose-6-phosphate isomerase-like protein (cupin superfamily)